MYANELNCQHDGIGHRGNSAKPKLGFLHTMSCIFTGQFFSTGAQPSLPEKYFNSIGKLLFLVLILTCKTALPDSPHPIIIVTKNPRFRALHRAG